jgi:predicted neuraminidase
VNWTTSQRLTWTANNSSYPAIAVDPSDNLHIVWYDSTVGNEEIYYKRSTDGGMHWTASERLTWTSYSSSYPAMAVDSSGKLYVVWHDLTPGNEEIYFKKSTDGGATWTPSQRLTWTSGTSYVPKIAVDPSGNVHVVWFDDTPGKYEIYHKRSTDGGGTWTTIQRLTWTLGESWDPAMAIDSSGNLHVLWHDDTPGNEEIYYKKSTDGGAAWTTSQRLTWTPGDSLVPEIAIDSSDNLHVLWHDLTPGNFEIYYKKGN